MCVWESACVCVCVCVCACVFMCVYMHFWSVLVQLCSYITPLVRSYHRTIKHCPHPPPPTISTDNCRKYSTHGRHPAVT